MSSRSRRLRDRLNPWPRSSSPSTKSKPTVALLVKHSPKPSLAKLRADGNAFTDALERYLDDLPLEERQSFSSTYRTVTLEDLLRKVEDADKADRESIPRLFVDRTSTFLKVLDDLLAATSSFASLGVPDAASVVIGGARLAIKMALRYVEFFDKLTGMMETLSIHLGHLHKLSEHPNLALLRESTAKVYGAILRFCHQAYGVFKKADDQDRGQIHLKTFLSTQWKPFEVQFGGVEKDIKDSLNALGHATGAETLDQTVQNGRTLDVLQGEAKLQTMILSEDQRHKYLHFLSSLDLDSIHKDTLRKRCPGTGNWLLEHKSFKDWFNNQDAQLLWCHGPPGVGKSMLSSIVMNHIENHPTTIPENVGKAFVSFRYDQMESQDPAKVIAAILKQLATQQKEFPIELVNFFSDHYKNDRYPSAEEITKMIATLGRRFAQTLIVMDALDECDEGPRERILNLIPKFKAKTFITSRPESSIREAFKSMAVPGFEIDTRSTQLDIERYVNDRLESLTRPLDHDIETDISGALVDRADGSFLWVHLQMEIICRQKNTKDIRKVLNNLPRGLNDTYTRILKKIENQDEPLRDLGLSCVIWVLKSRRPLSINELMGAVATNETCSSLEEVLENIGNYSEADILDASCNLLTLNYDDWGVKIVRFVHYSVAEFLGQKSSKHISSADFGNHELMETKLAKTCMVFLRLLSCENRDSSCTLEFLGYSGDHFDKHIVGAGELHYEELRPHINQLLSDQNTLEGLATWWQEPNTLEVNAWDIIHLSHLHNLSVITEDREWNGQEINFWPLRRIASQSAEHALELLRPKIIQKDQELDYDLEQWALIWDATSEDRLESLQKFLEAGLDPNKLDPTLGAMDWTALEMACWENKFEAMGMLLSHGAKGKEGNSTFSAALLVATQKGFGKISDLLLQNGAVAAEEMLVAVIAAPFDRYTDRTLLLDKILRQGVDPNEFSDLNLCILESDHRSLFLGEDADPTRQLYCTPLYCACKSYGFEKHAIIRLLLDYGADVNAISESGTALTAVIFDGYGEDETVEILLNAGARPDLAAGGWTSALEPAAAHGNVFAVERFLSAGSFNNVQLDSALRAATLWVGPGIRASYGPTSRLLLDHGANPRADRGASIISKKAELPLPGASRRGEESVVAALLTAGANVNESDTYGSPLESAICEIFRCDEIDPFRNLQAVIECLRKAGATEPRADCHVGVICNIPLCDQSKQGSWEGYERHPRNREEEYRIHHPAKLWINGTRYVCRKGTTSEINFCSSCAQKIESDRKPCRPDQEDASKMDMLDDDSETAPHQPDHEMTEMLENDITIQMEDLAANLRR